MTASFLEGAQILTPFDRLQRKVSDQYVVVTRYVREAVKLGADMGLNPDGALKRYFGKINSRAIDLHRKHVKPIRELMVKHKIKLEDAGTYAHARHAREANERFYQQYLELQRLKGARKALKKQAGQLNRRQAIEDDLRELDRRIEKKSFVARRIPASMDPEFFYHEVGALAGMRSSDGDLQTTKFERLPGFAELGHKIDTLNRETRRKMVEDGLLSEDGRQFMDSIFKHYVPLRDLDDQAQLLTGGSSFQVRGPEFEKREGRKSLPENPLIFSIVQATNAINRGEKNRVGNEMRDWLAGNRDILDSAEFKSTFGRDGTVDLKPTEFHIKVRGVDTTIDIMNQDLADALKRVGVPKIPKALRAVGRGMNVWRMMVTSLSPEFITSNFLRDIQTALVNTGSIASEFNQKGLRREVVAGVKSSWGTVFRHAREKDDRSAQGKMYREYLRVGGSTGTFTSQPFEELSASISKDISRAQRGGVAGSTIRGGTALLDVVEDINQATETAVRFSLYQTLRNRGVSAESAALAARQFTVDFSQKGQWGSAISLFYAFFSASVGGTRRVIEELARSKTSQQVAMGIVGFGAARTWLMETLSEDDDDGLTFFSKIDDGTKDKYMTFMLPGHREPLKVIKPWGYAFFDNLGQYAAEVAMGKRSMRSAGLRIAINGLDNFNPMGTAPDLLQFFTPTLLDPLVQVSTNTNFMGSPIAPAASPYGAETAASSEACHRSARQRRGSGERRGAEPCSTRGTRVSHSDAAAPGTAGLRRVAETVERRVSEGRDLGSASQDGSSQHFEEGAGYLSLVPCPQA